MKSANEHWRWIIKEPNISNLFSVTTEKFIEPIVLTAQYQFVCQLIFLSFLIKIYHTGKYLTHHKSSMTSANYLNYLSRIFKNLLPVRFNNQTQQSFNPLCTKKQIYTTSMKHINSNSQKNLNTYNSTYSHVGYTNEYACKF